MGFFMDILLALKASDKQIEEIDKQSLEKKTIDEKENWLGRFRWWRGIPITMTGITDDDDQGKNRWYDEEEVKETGN